MPILTTAAALFLAAVCLVRREWPGRREWRMGIAGSAVGVTSNATLFWGMDRMAERQLVALVYPIAVGVVARLS